MTVQQAISTGKVSLKEINQFVNGNLDTYSSIQVQLNELTGFENCKIDLNTEDDFTIDELLNSDLINEDFN